MNRSLLFIPSNTPAMLQNADVFSADAVIFDLEDAVFLSEKDAARHLLKSYLEHFKLKNIEVIVRINAIDTRLGLDDLSLIVSDHIDTIMLPKANLETLKHLDQHLEKIEKKKKLLKKIGIIPIIEKAQSLIEINQIATCKRVKGLLLGAEDLATDLEIERTSLGMEILLARSMVVLAAKAHGLEAIDTPFTQTQDFEGLKSDARFAKSLGMTGKACIHPNQIEIVNTLFSPSESEISQAQKILLAYEQSKMDQKGAFSVDGKMIDKPIIERAQKTLEKAKKWQIL
jgi:citrate lyase subunit beta / citryl-CoA lyase